MASFIFQPPDSEATGACCISAVKPTLVSTFSTLSCAGWLASAQTGSRMLGLKFHRLLCKKVAI
jgi:hypothetical protein